MEHTLKSDSKILITGGSGLVGYALQKRLRELGFTNIAAPSSKEFDLLDVSQAEKLFETTRPEYVFHNAARVYGIMGNMNNKGESYFANSMINLNTIEMCRKYSVQKIVAMGSGCVYPYPPVKLPLSVEDIWDGYPHSSEDSYAIAKRGMLAQLNAYQDSYSLDFAFVVSSNLFGPNDRFDEAEGHVIPALLSKFSSSLETGKRVEVWGNGSAQRDFLYSEDVAAALILIMRNIIGPVNMGSGDVSSIKEVVDLLSDISGVTDVVWDSSKPNGQDYRAYDLRVLKEAGFQPKHSLRSGLLETWNWFRENLQTARK